MTTGYTVSYSFTGYQALNPDEPLPAPQVDAEFANIATSITSIIDGLDDIRRADGALQNGVVTWDGLSADVQAKFDNLVARVVIGDINPSAFATQTEAQTGVANDKIVTPLRVKQALDTLRAYASQAEAQAGIENTKVMTALRTADAIAALRPYASQAEAQAGTDNAKVLTSLRVKQAIDAQRSSLFGTASLTWGSIAANSSATQTINVPGAQVGDRVEIGHILGAGFIPVGTVTATGVVTIRIFNVTGGALTPHGGVATTYNVTVVRF